MVLFLLGLVLGAIAGVSIDRMWARSERAIRLTLAFAIGDSVNGEQHFIYEVKNVGSHSIPDYAIGLFHPNRGTYYFFPSENTGPLLPGQIRKHHCVHTINGLHDESKKRWFYHERHEPVEEIVSQGFQLQLIIKNSDIVIYESQTIGNALAKQFAYVYGQLQGDRDAYEVFSELGTPRPNRWTKRWYRIQEILGLRTPIRNDMRDRVERSIRDAEQEK